jgi:hypothetical protein
VLLPVTLKTADYWDPMLYILVEFTGVSECPDYEGNRFL